MASILIVDAYDGFRATMEYCLPKFGHTACGAADARAAISLAEHRPVDLVLLDAGWPRLTGLVDCRMLRQTAALADKPIVILTGIFNADFVSRAKAAGATAVVMKPFEWTELLGVIARWGPAGGG